jgi:hypothetical protein
MAANGLIYTASFQGVTVTNAIQDIYEFIASANCSTLFHSFRVEFTPTITSGVAQDVRLNLQIVRRSTSGSGGAAVTPKPTNPRNTVAALTTVNRTVVTTQGTIQDILYGGNPSVIVPWERVYTADQRIDLPASGGSSQNRLCVFLAAAPGQSFVASGEVYFEEV